MTTFKRFDADDIVKANPTEVTTGIWTGDTGTLTSFFTSSTQATALSGQYYYNIYNVNPVTSSAEVQFAVAYGHRTGGGAASLANDNNSTLSTQATYSQYRNMLLDVSDSQFTFGTLNSDHIYVINIQRSRLKETLDPGNFALRLSGSLGTFTFIDDSGQTLGQQYGKAGAVFNLVSGSLTGASGSTVAVTASAASGTFGLVYPGLGLIVLNPNAISATIGMAAVAYSASAGAPFTPRTGSTTQEYNHMGLFNAIVKGGSFQARSAEMMSSTHYFVRLRNKEFNYSNNPSFFNESNGVINNTDFINDPRVYPTTIGLYNDNNELLAVAKLSKPVQKSFDKELLIRTRLDW
jgi:hypothetical protein